MVETLEVLAPNEKRCSKCREVKDKSEFGKTNQNNTGLKCYCKPCDNAVCRESRTRKRLENDLNCILCPECGIGFSNLAAHFKLLHGLDKAKLYDYGLSSFESPTLRGKRSLARKGPKHKERKGDFAEIGTRAISFPEKFWNSGCKFTKVKVLKKEKQVHFNPVNNSNVANIKAVKFPNETCHRLRISLHHEIIDTVKLFRPVFELRNGAGFYIQFYEQDEKLLEPFEFWAKSGQSMRNTSSLTIKNINHITIADHIWPINAEYVYPEFIASKLGTGYFDLIPISRTGFIVGVNKLNFKQYVGLENCHKLTKFGKRFRISLKSFIQEHNVPLGDWDLKEILPSGALRFVLTEPKAIPTIKQPALKKPDREPQPVYTPEGTFEEWLTEIGANDDIAI